MNFTLKHEDTTWQVINTATGEVVFTGEREQARAEMSRRNVLAAVVVVSPRKAARLTQLQERREGGQRA